MCFTLMVVSISFVMAWLRLQSGSLWTATIFHASHNLFIQSVFDPLTADTGLTKWIIGEFGLGLVITGALVGWLARKKRSEIPVALSTKRTTGKQGTRTGTDCTRSDERI